MRRPIQLVLLLAAVVACRSQRDVLPQQTPCEGPPPQALAAPAPPPPGEGPFRVLTRHEVGPAGGNTRSAVYADVDGDGAQDLLLGRFRGRDALLLNDGTGELWPADAGSLSRGAAPTFDLVAGDVTGDGRADVFCALGDGEPNQLHRQRGDGPLFEAWDGGDATAGGAKSHAAALVDLDADGDLDLLVANRDSPNQRLDNDGAGRFSERGDDPLARGAGNSRDLLVGDLDGDRWPDVVVVNGDDEPEQLLLNDGAGGLGLVDEGPLATLVGKSSAGALGDLDGDGDLDLVVVRRQGEGPRLWLNDGVGGFQLGPALPGGTGNSAAALLADLDGDDVLDLVLVDRKTAPDLLRGDGAGGFRSFADLPGPAVDATCCAAAALAAGRVELVLGRADGADLRLVLGR